MLTVPVMELAMEVLDQETGLDTEHQEIGKIGIGKRQGYHPAVFFGRRAQPPTKQGSILLCLCLFPVF